MNGEPHDRDETLDLLALGAAGALSDDEYRTLEAKLTADPDLAAEYRELQASAATLAEASSEAPPPALRASILDAIRDVEQLPPMITPAPVTYAAPAKVVPIHHRRWMIPATAAAAVVMLLTGSLLINRIADAPSPDRMAEVLNDDSAVSIPLTGSLEGLRLVTSEREGAAVLIGSDVERPDDGMVFELWAIHDDENVGMATFTPADSGEVAMLIEGTELRFEYAVTMEPAGGSDQPTSDPIALSPGLGA